MSLVQVVVLIVALQRLAELAFARRNTRRLLAAGGRETGAGHYPFLVLLHGAWLLALFALVPAEAQVNFGHLAVHRTILGSIHRRRGGAGPMAIDE